MAISKAQQQMVDVYAFMWRRKEVTKDMRQIGDNLPGQTITVWRGSAKTLSENLEISLPSIYKLVRLLSICGCIEMVRHGGVNTLSTYSLKRPPNDNEYELLKERNDMTGRTERVTPAQRAEDGINRLHTLYNALEVRVRRLEHEKN